MSKMKELAIAQANGERLDEAERIEKEAKDAFELAESIYLEPDADFGDDDDDGDWPIDRAF